MAVAAGSAPAASDGDLASPYSGALKIRSMRRPTRDNGARPVIAARVPRGRRTGLAPPVSPIPIADSGCKVGWAPPRGAPVDGIATGPCQTRVRGIVRRSLPKRRRGWRRFSRASPTASMRWIQRGASWCSTARRRHISAYVANNCWVAACSMCSRRGATPTSRPVRGAMSQGEAASLQAPSRRRPERTVELKITPMRSGGIAVVLTDVPDREVAEARRRLMVNELNHRVKNTLATVQAIATHSLRGPEVSDAARERLKARLMALARANDVAGRRWLARCDPRRCCSSGGRALWRRRSSAVCLGRSRGASETGAGCGGHVGAA